MDILKKKKERKKRVSVQLVQRINMARIDTTKLHTQTQTTTQQKQQ